MSRSECDPKSTTAAQAVEAGLVDPIGYMEDALREVKNLSGLPEEARLLVYRRTHFPDDNVYKPITTKETGRIPALIQLPLLESLTGPSAGFYCLWAPEYDRRQAAASFQKADPYGSAGRGHPRPCTSEQFLEEVDLSRAGEHRTHLLTISVLTFAGSGSIVPRLFRSGPFSRGQSR